MIFVDANYFIQAIIAPTTSKQRTMTEAAISFFRRIQAGDDEATTSDAVIAEFVFILSSKRHYNLPPHEVARRLKPILYLQGFKLPQKRICLRALDLWVAYPRLSFVDALGAAYSELQQLPLATFDGDFDRIPGLNRWRPSAAD